MAVSATRFSSVSNSCVEAVSVCSASWRQRSARERDLSLGNAVLDLFRQCFAFIRYYPIAERRVAHHTVINDDRPLLFWAGGGIKFEILRKSCVSRPTLRRKTPSLSRRARRFGLARGFSWSR